MDDPRLRGTWKPLGAATIEHPPAVHRLIAYRHGVWHIDQVDYPLPAGEFSDHDRQAWAAAGRPDPADPGRWHGWPYRVRTTWIAGFRRGIPPDPAPLRQTLRIPARTGPHPHRWWLYPDTQRWPVCSCCGEPMPCRQDIIDARAVYEMAELERHLTKLPGCCWGCTEPVTGRQHAVAYPGDNLDLPGGPDVQFHTRTHCRAAAKNYETRWLTAHPARTPILLAAAGHPATGG